MDTRNRDSPLVYICSPFSGDRERNTENMMAQFLTEKAEEPEIPLTLEERVAALERRVTALEGVG